MNRTLISLVVVGILAISGILGWIFLRTGPVKVPPPTPVDLVMPTVSTGELAFIEEMKREEIKREKEREELAKMRDITELARKDENIGLCDTITLEEVKRECRDEISLLMAANKGDPSLCDTISDTEKPKCLDATYLSMAIGAALTGSLDTRKSHCEKVGDTEKSSLCLGNIERLILDEKVAKGDALKSGDCESFSSTGARLDCQSRVAVERAEEVTTQAATASDAGPCATLPDASLRERCLDSVKYTSAKNESDPTLCREIKNIDMQLQCLSQVQKMTDQKLYRDALSTEKSDTCRSISDAPLEKDCLDKLALRRAVASGDSANCDILDPKDIDTCVQSIEILKNR